MFIKPITIPNRKNKKRYTYYRLCESYRTQRVTGYGPCGLKRQKTISCM
jgi:hypothetical protein